MSCEDFSVMAARGRRVRGAGSNPVSSLVTNKYGGVEHLAGSRDCKSRPIRHVGSTPITVTMIPYQDHVGTGPNSGR